MTDLDRKDESGTREQQSKKTHDIRSLMHGLLGYIAVFGDDIRDQLTVEQAQMLDRIEYFAQRLSDHVTDLLDR